MRRAESEEESRALQWQRRAVQAAFVAINLVLIDSRLPSVAWAIVGGMFWAAVIIITLTNGPVVCTWVCWLGAAQDWAEPLASRRLKLDPNFWRRVVLVIAIFWAPFSWLVRPDTMGLLVAPFGFNYTDLSAHILQAAFFVAVGLSVIVLGKRGACLYFCPLLMVSRFIRMKQWLRAFRTRRLFGKPLVINAAPAARQ